MGRIGWVLAAALAAFIAAVAGVAVGRLIWPVPPQPGAELHSLLHDELNLDPAQNAKLEALEASYAMQREQLEARMRADNGRLATAIKAEHGYGPQVAAAVNSSHMAMGELQKATLAHVFAMRQLLRPDQAARFDATVAATLTQADR
jgi:hypothetical protein